MGTLRRVPLWVLLVLLTPSNAMNTAQNNGVCSTWGNFHFKNFDGDIFYFPGTCNYIYASHCKSAYQDFNIQIRRAVVDNVPVIDKISMKLDGIVVQINNNTVTVNEKNVQLPYSGSGIQVEKHGVHLSVTSKLGLVFMWNDDDSLLLELDKKYAEQTCGLCGDFNGIIQNEFISNGIKMTEAQFGNLQKLDDPTELCPDVPPTPKSNCTDYEDICALSLLGSAFSKCHSLVDIAQYIEACVQDLCRCDSKNTALCMCDTFAEYSRQCAHAGGKPENWRTKDLCPKTCPNNMQYQECGSPCADTCTNPERSVLCEQYCEEGCFCPPGTVFDDINNFGCIPLDECSCTFNNEIYAAGANFSTTCSTCVCSGGKWSCNELPCSSTCSIDGGSHITTYDQSHYDIYGDCNYVLTKDCKGNSFIVLAELRKCGLSESETCLKSATIILNGGETMIVINPYGSVFVNSIYTQLPVSAASVTIFRPSSFYIVVETTLGVQVVAQLTPFMQVYVASDPSYKGQTCGLCGNFNDKQTDDFQTLSGVIEGTAASFANTWKTQADCANINNVYEDPCSLSVENEKYAQHWCGLLSDQSGPFASCHAIVNPEVYKKNCLFDTCNCEKNEECMCASLSAYVRACATKGVIVSGWRSTVCSKYMDSCPNTMSYTYSTSTCQPTCRSLSEPDITCGIKFTPVDGCTCAKGLYMDDSGKCIRAEDCPCYFKGSAVSSGEVVYDNGIMCTCSQGKLNCIGNVNPECTAPMVFFDCKNSSVGTIGAECQKSCQTLDMACYHTKCVSGCVCPAGLVSNGKGDCIQQEQCPCTYNGATYQPGEKIKMKCNTCTCKNRMWQCTKDPCLATCAVYGDGNYITFDEKRYSFKAGCEYTLAEDHCGKGGNGSTFRVITENIPCGSTGTICSKIIKVFLGSYELILMDENIEVVERGIGGVAPYNVRHMGIYLVIEADNGLILMWDRKTSIFIKLNKDFEGQVCGLCGNFDGNGNNDFTTRSLAVVEDVIEFGNSWKISSSCPDSNQPKDACSANPYRKSWAQKQCSIINSDVFSACHAQVDPSKYYDACVTDSCACDSGGDCECFCTAVAAYAQACGESGACVSWRSPNICPIFCDYYNPEGECEWHYKPCGAPCIKTCRNPNGKCIHELSGLEGCYPSCPSDKPFFDEDDMECVAQCGCYDDEGNHYKVGQLVPSKENCETCACSMSGIQCKYQKEACYCEYQGKMYKYNDVIYNTTDGIGGCISAVCKENGTIYRDIQDCHVSTTTPFTFTSTSLFTTTTGNTVPLTSVCVKEVCKWSQWFDASYPEPGMDSGDFETYENITAKGFTICDHPKDIICSATMFPDEQLSDLGQNVQCDVSFGLICLNEDQPSHNCYNYQIKVYCCSFESCDISTPSTTQTTGTTVPIITTESTSETDITTTFTTTETTSDNVQSPTGTISTTQSSTSETSISTATISTTSETIETTKLTTETGITETSKPTTTTTTETTETETTVPIITTESTSESDITTTFTTTELTSDNVQSPTVTISTTQSSTSETSMSTATISTTSATIETSKLTTETDIIETSKPTTTTTTETTETETTVPIITTESTSESDITSTFTTTEPTSDNVQSPTGTISTTQSSTSETSISTATISTTSETIETSKLTTETGITETSKPTTTTTTETTETETTVPIITTESTSESDITSTFTTTTGETVSSSAVCVKEVCKWSGWFDASYPEPGMDSGDFETYENITAKGFTICDHPKDIICSATMFPDEQLSDLGQNVQCDLSFGLICLNEDQPSHNCYNYKIKVYCCSFESCDISTPSTTPTTGTTVPIITTESTSETDITTTFTTTETTSDNAQSPTGTISTTQSSTSETSMSTATISTTSATIETSKLTTETDITETSKPTTTTTTETTETETTAPIITTESTSESDITSTFTTTETTSDNVQSPTGTISTTQSSTSETSMSTATISTTSATIETSKLTTETDIIETSKPTTTTTTETTETETTVPIITTESTSESDITSTFTTTTGETVSSSAVCVKEVCKWSGWFDASYPEPGMDSGDFETYENITAKGFTICDHPKDIICSATMFPDEQLSDLGQNVQCDVSFGLICLNEDQPSHNCYNYKIKVYCCSFESCDISTPSTTPTTGTTVPIITTESTSETDITTTFTTTETTSDNAQSPTGTISTTQSSTSETSMSTATISTTSATIETSKLTTETDITETSKPTTTTTTETTETETTAPIITTESTSESDITSTFTTTEPTSDNVQSPTGTISTTQSSTSETSMSTATISTTSETIETSKLTTETGITETSKPTTTTTTETTETETTVPIITTESTSETDITTTFTTTEPTSDNVQSPTVTISTTQSSTSETSMPTTSTTAKTTTENILTTSVSPTTTEPSTVITTKCFCRFDHKYFSPGEVIYNTTDAAGCSFYAVCNDSCEAERFTGPCITTKPPRTTTNPSSTPKDTTFFTTTNTIVSSPIIEGCPPHKTNETWKINNCTVATCHGNNVTTIKTVSCPKLKPLNCVNGFPPVKKMSEDGCCEYYECQCVCSGWGDPHYATFDATYYTFLDDCTYVLVQQIIPKYDNFRVLVDNYFCGARDGLSCPQSIMIYYKSNEIVLTRMMFQGKMKNRIKFNKDWVTPGFTKDGIIITSAGINMNVEIPEIDALISFSGLMFIVKLPFSKFAYNTEGQCGTCSNNSSEDCRLPNGQIVKDCSQMANHWKVNVDEKPYCNAPKPTAPPKPTPPTTCKPSSLCDIILSEVFAECHKVVSPKPYHKGCTFDSCRIPDDVVECSSLEIYASLCAANGICIDWRNKTKGHCPYNCPAGKVYDHCGPVHPNSCNNKEVQVRNSGYTEGCFCPKGTTLFNSYTDVCVEICSCVGPDGMPKGPGETWTSNCNSCTCEKNSLTVQCQPLTCPPLNDTSCDKEGFILKKLPDPHQPCCMKNECQCNRSYCQQNDKSCHLGFEVVPVFLENDCCPSYKCKPLEVCVFKGSLYNPGEEIPQSKDSCVDCVCTNEKDPETLLYRILCKPIQCHTECEPGTELSSSKGECCDTCKPNACKMKLSDNSTKIFKPDEKLSTPDEPCVEYECQIIDDQYIPVKNRKTCPTEECELGYEYEVEPGECCGTCIPYACVIYLSDNTTKTLEPEELYVPPEENCTMYTCSNTYDVEKISTKCPPLNHSICLEGTIKSDGCCETCEYALSGCQVHKQSQRIKNSTCESDQVVELSYCGGTCMTSSMYSDEANKMEHKCSCCQEVKTSKREINLKCLDGSSTVYTYIYAEECGCTNTECENDNQTSSP